LFARNATAVRRFSVIVGLLALPSLNAYLFHCLQRPRGQFGGQISQAIAYFVWGASYHPPLIAVWLVARYRLFESAAGCFRALIYPMAACYGYMCFHVLQDWLIGRYESMPIPGRALRKLAQL
jgi:hypothetical protein